MIIESMAGSFREMERDAEYMFNSTRPYWHLYTDGQSSDMIFSNREDMILGMNLMAVSCMLCPEVDVLTFELMNNHLHMIYAGQKTAGEKLFHTFKTRLGKVFSRNGKVVNLKGFECSVIEITSLQSLRNEIVYVNRNGFVTRPDCTPFTYPWGAGACFFNDFLNELPAKRLDDLTLRDRRAICHSNYLDFPTENLRVYKGVILPSSYSKIKKAESFFRNAHHYFQCLTRRFEAYSEIASRLQEKVFITDEEMYAATCALCLKTYNVKQPGLLSAPDRIAVAKRLKHDYNASNRQIKNILKLDKSIVEELFPGY